MPGLGCALLRTIPSGARFRSRGQRYFTSCLRVCCAACRYSQAQRDDRVWALVRRLGLVKVVHSFIGDAHVRGLSGGLGAAG